MITPCFIQTFYELAALVSLLGAACETPSTVVAIINAAEQIMPQNSTAFAGVQYVAIALDAQVRAANATEDQVWVAWFAIILSFFSIVLSFIGTYLIVCTLRETRKANDISTSLLKTELTPFIVMRPASGSGLVYREGHSSLNRVLFTLENVGRGPAIVTAVYRKWAVHPQYQHPDPIKPEQQGHDCKRKNPVEITVGPGSHSHEIDSFSSFRKVEQPPPDGWISFIGYVEFNDLEGNQYVTGFLHVFRLDMQDRGLHLALPEERGAEYNYHRRKLSRTADKPEPESAGASSKP